MPLYQAAVLALVQGITEFLPISSSAHLALAPWLLGWPDQTLVFDIALHFGTLAAVLLYFWRDWVQIVGYGFGRRGNSDPELARNPRLLWLILAATAPVGAVGLLVKDLAENAWRHNRVLIGFMLVAVGLLMLMAERLGRRRKGLADIGWADAMIIGTAQALALVPGTSRSGITISAGLLLGLERSAAARFSFLLSTPAVAAAAASAAWDLYRMGGIPPQMQLAFALGVGLSAVTGCLVIGFLLRYLREHTLKLFVYYRLAFGMMVIALAFLLRGHAG
ncbi:MAG: undecaprenyl-diphosphatase UppP [Bryobacterales bacterium]|nr:undecaprenyl-diphosphatase UppP [Bryobacteraceae bacterium]MDW8353160.1 undecaprenyl-diphosphatase UppP [Bryobacterales bacterium]